MIFSGFGSGYYHWDPDTNTLFWDRFFISLAMMAFFSIMLNERVLPEICPSKNSVITILIIFLGGLATIYWHLTEKSGHGDISLYSIILWTPTVLLPLILLMYPTCYKGNRYIFATFICFLLSRVCENFDKQIFDVLPISGHTLKHVSASFSILCVILYLKLRKKCSLRYCWKSA